MSGAGAGHTSEERGGVSHCGSLARAAMLLLLAGCGQSAPAKTSPVEDSASQIRRLAAEHKAGFEQAFPDLVEYLGRPLEHHDTLPDNSLKALQAWQAREDAWLQALTRLSFATGTAEWVLHGYLKNTLESAVATRACRVELWPAHQFGWQTTLIALLDQQPLGTDQLRAEALRRWSQLPRFLDTEMTNLREGLRLGYTAPRRNVQLAISQLDALLALPIDTSPLSGPMRRDDEESFRTRWSQLVETELLPATKRYRDFLSEDYAPRARTSLAITGIPQGAECYRAQIRTHTNYPLAPQELYELGEKLVAEREAKALRLARAEFGGGISDLRAARAALDADARSRFRSTADALAFVRQALARAEQAAPRWFSRVPRAPLTLVPYADFEAKAYPPARYEPAASDGSRPARFRIDVTNFDALQRAEVENTAFHEGIPGHHLQLGLEREMSTLLQPVDIRGLTAYFEGWARYGEGLAEEMGLYSSDLDRLGAAAHLPTGLVVDPGIHALNWTRESAVAWVMSKQVAFSTQEAEAYVDRIAVCPGEMLSYGFGERELVALRQEAEATLGQRFDIKVFHDKVLAHGAIPLPMVREVISQWIHE